MNSVLVLFFVKTIRTPFEPLLDCTYLDYDTLSETELRAAIDKLSLHDNIFFRFQNYKKKIEYVQRTHICCYIYIYIYFFRLTHSTVAAVIIEPVQGEGGLRVASSQFLRSLRVMNCCVHCCVY